MNHLLTVISFTALAGLAAAQDTAAIAPAAASRQSSVPARKTGTLFKSEVDRLIGALRLRARADETEMPLGGDSTLATAQALCAMGHCHRYYHVSDGPVVRPSLQALIRARNADGSFGRGDAQATTTAWVVDALTVMDRDGFRDEIAMAREWLAKQGAEAQGFDALVQHVLAETRGDRFPQHVGASAAKFADDVAGDPAALDPEPAARELARLVACQVANRRLDDGQDPAGKAAFSPTQQKAFAWLMTQQKEGVFSATYGDRTFPDPAFTGFGLLALQTKPKGMRSKEEQAVIDQGIQWLLKQQNEDGSFGQQVQNYTTSVVIGALAKWGGTETRTAMEKAQKYILACQNVESTGYQRSDRDYGSIGYGATNAQRGDLSNMNFALQALRESGLPANDEAFRKALVFLQRTQNLKSVNDFTGKVPDPDQDGKLVESTSGDDGGSAYYPGNSGAGFAVQPDGKVVPRSYGSMTYALLKAYMLCGLSADDPRVQAAVQWVQNNWTLAINPGFERVEGKTLEYQGLFYYYMMLAQALDLVGVREVNTMGEDKKPVTIDWKKALHEKLAGMQAANGSWTNEKNSRWMEDSPILCTCYALVALQHCQ